MKLSTIMGAGLGFALFASTTLGASAQTLRFSSMVPNGHPYTERVLQVWADNVAEATEGRVTVEFLPTMVGTPTTQLEVVEDGLADVAFIVPGYWPGRTDLLGIVEAPTMSARSAAASVATWRFYQNELLPAGVLSEIHMVMVGVSTPGALFTLGEPLTSVEQLEGMKIRNPLQMTRVMLEGVGAVPISRPATEAYELMSSGIVDGSLAGLESVIPYRYPDIVQGFTSFEGGLYNPTLAVIMNLDTWESISEEDRAAIDAVSGEALALLSGNVLQEAADAAFNTMIEQGIAHADADEAFVAAIREASAPVFENLVQLAADAGLEDPEGVFDRFRAMVAEARAELEYRREVDALCKRWTRQHDKGHRAERDDRRSRCHERSPLSRSNTAVTRATCPWVSRKGGMPPWRVTASGPALYAARAREPSPNCSSIISK
jgi:TRAP-type C4-dicarboxylate transport system substrate-binding protein